MSNIISNSSSFEDLVKIINSLNLKINDLEKKVNVLESNSHYNFSNEVFIDETLFRSITAVPPPIVRQNAFNL